MGMLMRHRQEKELQFVEIEPEEKHETKAELVEKAKKLGVNVPANASKAKLQELIGKHSKQES